MPTISEIKELKGLLDSKSTEDLVRKTAYIIFLSSIYFGILLIFQKQKLYSYEPFISIVNLGVLPHEITEGIIALLALLSLIFLSSLCFLVYENRWNLPLLFREYKWNPEKGLSDWDFQGNIVVDYAEKAMHIIQSDLGCIIHNLNWKNFEMCFEFKIPDPPPLSPADSEGNRQLRRGFGIIYRAKRLGEYYMIKIDENGCLPHVRNISWENNGSIWNPRLGLQDLNLWIAIKITVMNNSLTIEMRNKKFSFTIPTHSYTHRDNKPRKKAESSEVFSPFLPIRFRNTGSVGFRSAPLEEVFIRNLVIKRSL